MAKVGTITVSRVSGTPQKMTERIVTWQTPGYDGQGVHRLGKVPNPTPLLVVVYSTVDGVKTIYQQISELKSQIVAIINDQNQQFTNVLIEQVGKLDVQTAFPTPGARGSFEIVVSWGE